MARSPIGNGRKASARSQRRAGPRQSDCRAAAAQRRPRSPARLAGAELESFLINFVVEQTGYPTEVVELDADLEADLGIDSIKKAQLFGELREYFDVTPSEDLSLDDFPTLRHVLKFLQGAPIKGERRGGGAASQRAAYRTSPARMPSRGSLCGRGGSSRRRRRCPPRRPARNWNRS